MNRALNVFGRLHWSLWAGGAFLCLWVLWALDSSMHQVAPGLMDDGSYLRTALRYREHGILNLVLQHLGEITKPQGRPRFYDVQYGLVGLYAKLFALDLRYWYLSNFFLCLLTGIAAYGTVIWLTRDRTAPLLALIGTLTISPLADAARANFGKSEVVMMAAFMLALASFVGAWKLLLLPASFRRNLFIALAVLIGVVSLAVASVGKESGRLLVTAFLMIPVFVIATPFLRRVARSRLPRLVDRLPRFIRHEDEAASSRRGLLVCFVVGAMILGASAYVFREDGSSDYLVRYFTLNFGPRHLFTSLRTYWVQSLDQIVLLAILLPIAAFGFFGQRRVWAVLASLVAVAGCYGFLLLAFHFQVSYYVYVPAVLTAVAFALAFAVATPRLRLALVCVFALTRVYSIPHIYFQAAAQKYVDYVNFQAMEAAADLGATRVILLDLDEKSQIIQEWNLLRAIYFDGGLPALIGGLPEFKLWDYQERIRSRPLLPTKDKPPRAGRTDPAPEQTAEPQVGDVIAVRFGRARAGKITLRAVLPIVMHEKMAEGIIDPQALAPAARVGGIVPGVMPCSCLVGEFNFGWQFYRVVAPARYLIVGQDLDGWMKQETTVRIGRADPGRELMLHIEVPRWMPIEYPTTISAALDGKTLTELKVPAAGRYTLSIPLDREGDVKIRAETCYHPSSILNAETRALCYLRTGSELR